MVKQAFSKRTLARQALDKMPNVDNRTLAKFLMGKNPGVFNTLESARSCVRAVRGASGKANRTKGAATHIREPIEVPEANESDWQVHELPEEIKNWLVISDLHIPYHSPKAVKLALEFGRAEGCDGVLINGDFPDFYQLSRFDKDPTKVAPIDEIKICKRMLDAIEKVGAKKIVYKGGNHCARLPRYLMQACPLAFEIVDLKCNMTTILDLDKRGIDFIPDMHPIRHHNLSIVHGHEWGQGVFNPVNPARGAFLRSYDNILMGHSHRTSEHNEANIRDVNITCKSVGCLCELHPSYRALGNRWNHGFAVLHAGDKWSIDNYRIIRECEIVK